MHASVCVCVRALPCVSHPWSRGCFRVTLLPPGGPQALQEVLVGGVGGVKDGETQDGGGVMEEQGVQLEEREVLQEDDTHCHLSTEPVETLDAAWWLVWELLMT